MSRNRFAVVLPARYGSSRFPGKPLVEIAGRPLIEWVYRRAEQIKGFGELLVATDDRRIADAVEGFGGNVTITAGGHETGTDRVAEVARSLEFEYVVNLQGDEPVFDPSMVEAMMDRLVDYPGTDIMTACHPISSIDEQLDPNIVKVVMDGEQRALYFSRSPIPYGAFEQTGPGGDESARPVFRHVGVYAFTNDALQRFAALPRTILEQHERLEQLRALENGMKIGLVVTSKPTMGVDVPSDVKKVEKEIAKIYTD